MIKQLDRYLVLELVAPFMVGVTGFLLIEIGTVIYNLIDLIVQNHIGLWIVGQLLLFRMPKLLVYALPIATLFGVSLAVNRLAREGEVTAIRMAGVPLRRLFLPMVLVGALVSGFTFELNEHIAPWSNHRFAQVWRTMLLTRPEPDIRSDVFFSADGRQFYVRQVEKTGAGQVLLHDLIMYEVQLKGYPVITTCHLATTDGQVWHLEHGVTILLGRDGQFRDQITFGELDVNLKRPIEDMLADQRSADEMSSGELAHELALYQASHISIPSLRTEYQCKFSLPCASLVLALLSAPLALRYARSGGFAGILLSIVLFFFYYNTYFLTNHLGANGALPPVLAAWLPNALFSGLGVALVQIEE